MNLLFLDIDGVLNDHRWNEKAQCSYIHKRNVDELNRILNNCDAQIVISSAWRYQIGKGATTLKGFEYMLRSHGVWCADRVLGYTCSDEIEPDRGNQISNFMKYFDLFNIDDESNVIDNYVIIDDVEINGHDGHKVQPYGCAGLQMNDAIKALEILGIKHDPWKHTNTRIDK